MGCCHRQQIGLGSFVPVEELTRAQRLLAQQFNDAPRELAATIDLAMNATRRGSLGEALNELNRAHDLVNKNKLDEWRAEVAAAWAVFYYRSNEPKKMNQAISYAKKREPNNRRLNALLKVLEDK